MMKLTTTFAIALLFSGAKLARAAEYTLDANQSELLVLLKPDKSALLSSFSHQHVIRATGWKGSVRYDPAQPNVCTVKVEVPVSGLVADEPQLRKRFGFNKKISNGDRESVVDNLRDQDQLFMRAFPKITFEASGCRLVKKDSLEVSGKMVVRGVGKKIKVPMEIQLEGTKLVAQTRFKLRHADFRFKPYSGGLGAVRNHEELSFVMKFVGRTKP